MSNNIKINYVIATYNGICRRTHKFPNPENVLIEHLNKISQLKHNISQITVMKSQSCNYYKNYYNIDEISKKINIPIKIIDCENYGYSEGQWLKAYELFKNDFDYYLFVEDDYCAGMDNFDTILMNCYNNKFNNNIGLLCSLVEGSKEYKNKGGYPIHFEGCVFINNKTLEKLYNNPKWENNPRKYLDLIDNKIDSNFNWERQRKSYIGGYYQLTFSHLFTLSEIDHEDYLNIQYNNKLLQFPYWNDNRSKTIGGEIYFYNKGDIVRRSYTLNDIYNSPIIPIQLKDLICIKHNTNLSL